MTRRPHSTTEDLSVNFNKIHIVELNQIVKDVSLSLFFGAKSITPETLAVYQRLLNQHATQYQTKCKFLNLLGIQVFLINLMSCLLIIVMKFDPPNHITAINIIHDLLIIVITVFKYKMANIIRSKPWYRNRQLETGLLTVRINAICALILEDTNITISLDDNQPNLTKSEDENDQEHDNSHVQYKVLYLLNALWIGYHATGLYFIQKMILIVRLIKKAKSIGRRLKARNNDKVKHQRRRYKKRKQATEGSSHTEKSKKSYKTRTPEIPTITTSESQSSPDSPETPNRIIPEILTKKFKKEFSVPASPEPPKPTEIPKPIVTLQPTKGAKTVQIIENKAKEIKFQATDNKENDVEKTESQETKQNSVESVVDAKSTETHIVIDSPQSNKHKVVDDTTNMGALFVVPGTFVTTASGTAELGIVPIIDAPTVTDEDNQKRIDMKTNKTNQPTNVQTQIIANGKNNNLGIPKHGILKHNTNKTLDSNKPQKVHFVKSLLSSMKTKTEKKEIKENRHPMHHDKSKSNKHETAKVSTKQKIDESKSSQSPKFEANERAKIHESQKHKKSDRKDSEKKKRLQSQHRKRKED